MFWRHHRDLAHDPFNPTVTPLAGSLAALALCVSIAGVNLPNPLVPVYAERFALTPMLQTALFSAYLLALLATLIVAVTHSAHSLRTELVMIIVAVTHSAHSLRTELVMIIVATALVVIADLTMLAGSATFALLVAGRAIAGIAAGVATGAASAVALAGLGERSRTVAGSAAVVGALAANLLGGLLAALLPIPFLAIYLGHAGLAAILGIGLWLTSGRRRLPPPLPQQAANIASTRRYRSRPAHVSYMHTVHHAVHPVAELVGSYEHRHRVAGYVLGALAWSSAGLVLALLAAQLRQSRPDFSLLQTMIPGCIFLGCAWVGQLSLQRRLLQLRAWMTCVPLVVGTLGIGVALQSGNWLTLLIPSAIAGFGQGPSYSLGLATVTHGLSPIRQARASSTYAAVAYGICGVFTLAVGAVANVIGVPDALLTSAGLFAVASSVAVILAGPAQQLKFELM